MSKKKSGKAVKKQRAQTRFVHMGRDPKEYFGIVNPPIVRTSTILYPSLEAFGDKNHKYRYGNLGTPLSDKFEAAMAELEGGAGAVSMPTGMAAITVPLLTFLKSGDHVLITDSVYEPTRGFCNRVLTRMGVEVQYYDPLIGSDIKTLFKNNTRVVYLESPGSATYEVQDVPAIAKACKNKNIVTIIDNTWSSGILFRPLEHGVDVSLQAATKYIGGHADVNLGFAVASDPAHVTAMRHCAWDLGMMPAPEDLYLALRGLRTMNLRLKQSGESALEIAKWLEKRPEVQRVYYPALPSHGSHKIWKRDFNGANGILSLLLEPASQKAVTAFVDALEFFPVGSSWGAYESLLQPQYLKRAAVPWTEKGALLRLQIGLEDPQDLKEDLDQAFAIFKKTK